MKQWTTMSMAFAAALAVSGCKKGGEEGGSGGASGGSEPAVEATPECVAAGEQVQSLRLQKTPADAPDQEKAKAFGQARELGDQVAAACTNDKWPAEAIECVKGAEDLAACKDKLSPEQQKALPTL